MVVNDEEMRERWRAKKSQWGSRVVGVDMELWCDIKCQKAGDSDNNRQPSLG
jgi:hypothetical protein